MKILVALVASFVLALGAVALVLALGGAGLVIATTALHSVAPAVPALGLWTGMQVALGALLLRMALGASK